MYVHITCIHTYIFTYTHTHKDIDTDTQICKKQVSRDTFLEGRYTHIDIYKHMHTRTSTYTTRAQ